MRKFEPFFWIRNRTCYIQFGFSKINVRKQNNSTWQRKLTNTVSKEQSNFEEVTYATNKSTSEKFWGEWITSSANITFPWLDYKFHDEFYFKESKIQRGSCTILPLHRHQNCLYTLMSTTIRTFPQFLIMNSNLTFVQFDHHRQSGPVF